MPQQKRPLRPMSNGGRSQVIPAAISPDRAEIARLAYLYWLDRGCPMGSPEEDWSRAEEKLKKEPIPTT